MYIDAMFLREKNTILISERINGQRTLQELPVDYTFYYEDTKGKFDSIFGTKLAKVSPTTFEEYNKLKNIHSNKKLYEVDANLIFRCLEKNYSHTAPPKLHVAFFDIETAFDKDLGYSPASEAFNPITAISIHLQWLNQTICLSVPPKTISNETATAIADKVGNVILYQSEKKMLETFLTLIEDADVLSGWNSEFYDIPYVINRVHKLLGKHETRKLCLWNQIPRKRNVETFGKKEVVFDLIGRIHMDYLSLYKKYSYEERQSYKLDSIAESELNDRKVEYDGTLDQLYKQDYETFLRYSIHDTVLLDRLDKKLQYIDLANGIAHDAGVLIATAMGTVSMMEQVITLEAHSDNKIMPSRNHREEVEYDDRVYASEDDEDDNSDRAAGGWVMKPKVGIIKWPANTDINSLYPSVIRALNMSPETIVGQLRTNETDAAINNFLAEARRNTFSEWWNDRFTTLEMDRFMKNDNNDTLWFDIEGANSVQITGAELRKLVFDPENNWMISANGTVFRKDVVGVVPRLLTRWYSERKALQKKYKYFANLNSGFTLEKKYKNYVTNDTRLLQFSDVLNLSFDELVSAARDETTLHQFLSHWGLELKGGLVYPRKEFKELYKDAESYWDKKQLVKKILLNSCYGGLLNPHMKFFDQRIGQSTTLTGRCINRHMASKTNEMLCGEYDHYGKCIVAGDTDSVYFSVWPEIGSEIEQGKIDWNEDIAVKLYDEIATTVSDTFPEFLKTTFNVELENGKIIKSGREIIGKTGYFLKKKRYALHYFDKEGIRCDIEGKDGKIKITGLDLKRSDTPHYMQVFLMEVLTDLLKGKDQEFILSKIKEFKKVVKGMLAWQRGPVRAVNNLTSYKERDEQYLSDKIRGLVPKALTVPGHVRASINWNAMRERNRDLNSIKIVDGQKIVMCPLKKNDFGITSIAYPIDEVRLPEWFKTLPFDEEQLMESLVDKKLQNLLGPLRFPLEKTDERAEVFDSLFTF